jgi:hypothetical protein
MKAIVLLAVLGGCPAAQLTPTERALVDIEALRERAEENPNDPAVWRELAEAEILAPGGDPERAPLERAAELAPNDPIVPLLGALLASEHGEPTRALPLYVETIDKARTSDDPLAPIAAEIAILRAEWLRSEVRGYEATMLPVARRVLAEPGRLGLPSKVYASSVVVRDADRRSDAAALRQALAGMGCLTDFRFTGPFGRHPNLDFDRPFPAIAEGPLADSYDLGHMRGVRETRHEETTHCGVNLAEEGAGGGIFVAETFYEASADGPHFVYLSSGASFDLRVDGTRIGRVDRRAIAPGRAFGFPVELRRGRHEIEVTVAADSEPWIAVRIERSEGDYDPSRGAELPEASTPLTALLRSIGSAGRGDSLEARESLRRFARRDAGAVMLVARARAASVDPFLPRDRAIDEERQWLQQAARRDEHAYHPARRLAQLENDERVAIEKMQRVVERWPDMPSNHLALAAQLENLGLDESIDAHIARAIELAPESCEVLSVRRERLFNRWRVDEANALLPGWAGACGEELATFDRLVAERRFDEARAELVRVTPTLDDDERRIRERTLALALGDVATADRIRDELERESDADALRNARLVRDVDDLVAASRTREAVARIDAAFGDRPRDTIQFRTTRRMLAGTDWHEPHRLDGDAVRREFESSGRAYADAPRVLVLDSMVVRVYPDGTSSELIHQIHRVQSEEAIEALSQMNFSGRLLRLRTIKPDGRVLEPDGEFGTGSIVLPNLAVGDYVEYEYVRDHGPGTDGAFASMGWVFQSYDQPFDWSRLVLIAPRSLAIDIDQRGPLSAPEEVVDGDLLVRTWSVRESRPLVDEPGRAPGHEDLPFVQFAGRWTWPQHFEDLRNDLAAADKLDPSARRFVHDLLGSRPRGPRDRARALYHWVTDHIEPGGSFTDQAPLVLAARRGSRTRVLRYLLDLAGLDAELAISPTYGEARRPPFPDSDHYDTALVWLRGLEGGDLFLWPEAEGVPFGYLPPNVRGMRAIGLVEGHPELELPDPGVDNDRRVISVDVELERDGSGVVEVVEEHRGGAAFGMRSELAEIPDAELEQVFESGYAAQIFSGGELERLEVTGRHDPDAPLVFRYRLRLPSAGRRAGNEQLMPLYHGIPLAGMYAGLPVRRTTELVWGTARSVRLRVRGPGAPARAPADVSFRDPSGLRYSRRSHADSTGVVVERELVVPRMLVEPARYQAFARACRTIDEHESESVRVGL